MSIKLKDTIYDLIDNADKLDGVHNGNLTAKYFAQGDILTSSDTINKLMSGIYCYINANNPTGSIDDNAILLSFRNSGRTDMIQFVGAANSEKLYYRRAANIGNQYENWTDWKTIAFIDSKVNSAGYADSAGTANSVAWGNVSGKPSSFTPSSHSHEYASTVKVGSTSYTSSSNVISLPAFPTLSSLGAAASSHTHSYLPLSGGNLTGLLTTTGDINFYGNGKDTYTMGSIFCRSDSEFTIEAPIATNEYGGTKKAILLTWRGGYNQGGLRLTGGSNGELGGKAILHAGNYTSYCASKDHNHNSSYVTALGTSGNYLTWTKNGSTNNITVPYATKAVQDSDGNAINSTYLKKSKLGFDIDTYTFNVGQSDLGWIYLGYFFGSNSGMKIECDYASHCGNDYGIFASHLIVGVRPYTLQGFVSKVKGSQGGLYITEENTSNNGYKNYHIYIYLGAWYQGQVRIQKLGSNDFVWCKTSASPNSSHTCVLDTRTLDGYYVCHKGSVTKVSNSYNDLTNKPTIPSVGNGTITIKQAGAQKGTFTLNQSGNTTIELTDANTWRGITNSYSGTATDTSLSQKGGNALYNALVNGYASSAGNASYLQLTESGTVANTWGSHGTKSFIGGWASTSAGFSRQYGTTLNISGYSTWYHRLAFTTSGEIEHWMGINTTTLSRVGYLAYTYQIPTSLPANGGNADTTDNHHFSTVSSLPSSPNSSTVYFIV